ncbi:MAG: hypothetical protein A2744_03250 [Candidatus Buchananbacteria bacterium RIFCSPHIGHO2_01_FULL_44_11]|uniref:Rrf2 family transcriptional regulator n=1 Tax=Candidatus Buchananbacteria bacterium RIFCSPHIGHO2_01_FULL_44_11 TaxID=1797535 RepID=A0A1G1Y277_9BACT|nr:MAG: hypothetical protein A2744_03250 [Candidatus Buchananbacteria bacterium RIFCSPHIGHO2_01_FULL_44_11]
MLGLVSTREEYGLRLIIQLAKTYYDHQPVSLAEIGQKENLSVKYLEQIIMPFRQAHWLKSQRGRTGGYVMVKNPKKVSLKDVVKLLAAGNDFLVPCLDRHRGCPNGLERLCLSRKAWGKIQKNLEDSLVKINLAELIKQPNFRIP